MISKSNPNQHSTRAIHQRWMPTVELIKLAWWKSSLPCMFLLMVAVLAAAGCARSEAAANSTPEPTTEQKMVALLQAYQKAQGFMGAVLVARGDEVLHSGGYGMANLEHDAPNTPETVFRIGSLTKQFTAAAILQLQEQGRLNINDTLDRYLPDAPHASQVTLAQLLTHSSGIPDAPEIAEGSHGGDLRQPRTADEMISRAGGKPLEFTPGSQYKYCNVCYIMLSRVVEKVSGKSYADYLQEHILLPAGMTGTGIDEAGSVVPRRAAGYNWDGQSYRNAQFIEMSNVSGAGSLISTVGDMYKWDRALYTDAILSSAAREAYFTPRVSLGAGQSYAYGWRIKATPDHTLAEHSGGINGFNAFVIRDPVTQLYVVVLGNVEEVSSQNVAEGLAAIAYGEPYDMPGEPNAAGALPVAPAVLEKYAGSYQVTADMVVLITAEGSRLFAEVPGQPKFELFPTSETDFIAKVADIKLQFLVGADGTVTEVVIREGGQEIHAAKLR